MQRHFKSDSRSEPKYQMSSEQLSHDQSFVTAEEQSKKSNSLQTDVKPTFQTSQDSVPTPEKVKGAKAPLLEEHSKYKCFTTENKNILKPNFQFNESEGEMHEETPDYSKSKSKSQQSELILQTNSEEISRTEKIIAVTQSEQEKSDIDSQMVPVTHGTQEDNSSEDGYVD